MPDRELELTIKANGFETVNQVFEGMKKVGGASRATAADLGLYEVAVKNGIITGSEFNRVLNAITQNEKRAADEVQRYGQMVARAEAEDRRRTAALEAKAKAQERATAAEAKAAQSQTLAGARGAAGLGQLAGILPGGASTAVYGASSLLNAGLSTTTAAAGAAAFAIGILSVGVVKAANSLGEYARQQENLAERTGLTTQQIQLFSRAAGLVDVNAGSLTTSMRTLSKALSDNSEEGKKAKEALAELGIGTVDQLLPMGELLPLISRRLGSMADGAEKDRIAIALLGRSALELLPLLNNLDKLTGAVRESGVVIDEEGIKKALLYQAEIKQLGLAWDSLTNKFKQIAVGTVSVVFTSAGTATALIDSGTAARGNPLTSGLATLLSSIQGGFVGPPSGVKSAFPKFDPSQLRLNQRESEISGINNAFNTPKEQIDQRIKSLKELQQTAESAYRGARSGPERDSAEAQLRNTDRQLRAAEQQRDYLKDGKRASEETLRLREELIGATAKEFAGEEKITAEYEKQIQRLEDKREATPENVNLAGQIRDANLARYRQQAAIVATESQRAVDEATLRAGQDRVRSTTSRRGQLALQGFSLSGNESGGISARESQEVSDAKQEYEFARQIAAVKIASAEKDHAERGDDLKYLQQLTEAQTSEIAARATMEDRISNARLQAQIALNALKEKNRKEEEQSAEENIKRGRQYSDIRFGVARATTEGQSRLNVANAAPGFELQAQLDADQTKLALDRAQSLINQSRSSQDIDKITTLKNNDPVHDREINKQIADIKLESAKEAAKIEEDTIKARFDAETRLAEKRKQDEEAFRNAVSGFVSAARQGRGQDYLRGIGEKWLGTITGNVAGLAFPAVDKQVSGIAKSISGTTANPTFLGKLLSGTPFGPQTTGASANVAATSANTSALVSSTAAITLLSDTINAIVTGQSLPSGAAPSGLSPFGIPSFGGLGSLGSPGLGTLGSSIGIFGSDTNGITGNGPLTDVFGNPIPNPNLANQDIVRATLAANATSSSSGGFGSGLAHTGDLSAVFTGTTYSGKQLSGAQQAGAAIGTAGVIYSGVSSALKDFSRGSAKGDISGIGDVAGTIAALDPEPISKAILGGVALGSKVIAALFGDPRQNRENQINTELARNQYQAPATQNRTQDIFGDYTDADKYGHLQTSSFSAVPQTTAPYITKRNGTYYDVPSTITSPFTPSTNASNPPPINQYNTFSSIDPKSAMDYFKSNPDVANGIVHAGLTMATGGAQAAVRKTAGLN